MKHSLIKLLFIFLYITGSNAVMAETQTTILVAPTMNCAVCPITVRKALEKVEGVEHVSTEFESRTITVMFDDAKTNISTLTKTTANSGYPSKVKGDSTDEQ